MSNSNIAQESRNYPVQGAYVQSAPGITQQVVTPTDVSGNVQISMGAAAGLSYFGVSSYRDAAITVQAAASAAAPGALGTVATITPGTAGLWEVSGTVSISGTTVATAETNNVQLRQTTTARLTNIPIGVNGTTGAPGAVPYGPIILNLSAIDTVNLVAVGASTASSIYGGQIIARRVG